MKAYSLDVFPDLSVETAAVINVFRTAGFILNYFIVDWATADGPLIAFGEQASVCGGAFILALLVQLFGRGWRAKYPSPTLRKQYGG